MKLGSLFATALGCAFMLAGQAGRAADSPATGIEACASVSASFRMQAVGYKHIVTLVNRCSRPVACEVWTNVDPSPRLLLKADPGESAEVVTRIGSPSRDVQAGKTCHYEG